MKQDFLLQAKQLQKTLSEHRRWLHAHAETGFELPQTKEYVRQQLTAMGYHPIPCGKCGLMAELSGGSGKTILLRADMDALPIREEAVVEFASQNGNMHACGHDLHTSMLLGAAQMLMNHRHEIQGTVRLMFQPAEEILSGAENMIRSGVLQNVDAAVMIHVSVATPLKTGTIIVAPSGVSAPAASYFTIRVQGKGCHGAAPHKGVDALSTAAHILIALQEIHARELPSVSGAVLTVGRFSGGAADNAIADSAELHGTVRAFEDDTMQFLKERIRDISRAIAEAFRAGVQVTFNRECPTLKNDETLCTMAYQQLGELLGQQRVLSISTLDRGGAGGSEDFAYISQQVPSVMLSLAAGQPDHGYCYPLHHPKVIFDEDALPVGAAALAGLAIRFLSNA